MEEIGDLAAELVERAEEAGVELVVLLKQLLDDRFPDALGGDFGMLLAAAGTDALFGRGLRVDLAQIVGRLAGLARHRGPHLELLDGLVQGHVHDERCGMLEAQVAAGDGRAGCRRRSTGRRHLGQTHEMRPGLGPIHLGAAGQGRSSRVEISRVLFQRQGHAVPRLRRKESSNKLTGEMQACKGRTAAASRRCYFSVWRLAALVIQGGGHLAARDGAHRLKGHAVRRAGPDVADEVDRPVGEQEVGAAGVHAGSIVQVLPVGLLFVPAWMRTKSPAPWPSLPGTALRLNWPWLQ